VAVELDSRAYHLTRAAFERDRERDAVLQGFGVRVIRVTDRRLTHQAGAVVRDIRRLLALGGYGPGRNG
jgi:very-short-patch-repair endonuclease